MRLTLTLLLLLLGPSLTMAQQDAYWEEWSDQQIDSLKREWKYNANDTLRMAIARSLGFYFQENNRDSSFYFHENELRLAKLLRQRLWEGDACNQVAYVLTQVKDYPRAFQTFLDGIRILEDESAEYSVWRASRFAKNGDPHTARLTALGFIYQDIAVLYTDVGNVRKALEHYRLAARIAASIDNYRSLSIVNTNIASIYAEANELDSALIYAELGLENANKSGFHKYRGFPLYTLGNIYLNMGDFGRSRAFLIESAKQHSSINDNVSGIAEAQIGLARLFKALGKLDSSKLFAVKAINILHSLNSPQELTEAYLVLSSVFQSQGRIDSAFKYQSLAIVEKEKVVDLKKLIQFQAIGLNEQLRLRKLEEERIETLAKIRMYVLLSSLVVALLVGILLYRNNRQKQSANTQLRLQRDEIQFDRMHQLDAEQRVAVQHVEPIRFLLHAWREFLRNAASKQQRPTVRVVGLRFAVRFRFQFRISCV